MSKKDTKKVEQENVENNDLFKYGVAPSLLINMVKENRVYRFEMPIGAKLDECHEACTECLNVVKKMIEEAEKKKTEAEKEQKEETSEEKTDESFENLDE